MSPYTVGMLVLSILWCVCSMIFHVYRDNYVLSAAEESMCCRVTRRTSNREHVASLTEGGSGIVDGEDRDREEMGSIEGREVKICVSVNILGSTCSQSLAWIKIGQMYVY